MDSDTLLRHPDRTAPSEPHPGLVGSITAWSVRRRWWVLLGAAALVAAAVAIFVTQGLRTMSPADQLVGDSRQASQITTTTDFGEPVTEQVVVTLREGPLTPTQVRRVETEVGTALAGVKGVEQVLPAITGADGQTVVIPVAMAADFDDDTALKEPVDVVGPMVDRIAQLGADHPGWEVGQLGDGSINKEVNETIGQDFKKAEFISLPITLLILLFAFGALVAAGVPLLLGMASVGVAFGLTAVVSQQWLPVDPNAQSLVLLIGLAVGVDYALFLMRRAREERAAGADKRQAIMRAGATAGRAVVISGLTVMVAMSGMLVAGGLFASLAVGTILVIGVSVLASVTLLPALLAVLGDSVDWVRLPYLHRRRATQDPATSWSGRLAHRVSQRPLAWLLVGGGLLVAVSVPALGMRTALPGVEALPQELQIVQTYKRLEPAIPTEGSALQLVVRTADANDPAVGSALLDAATSAQRIDHVAAVAPQPRISLDGEVAVLDIAVDLTSSDDALPGVIERVRDDVATPLRAELTKLDAGSAVHVGGIAEGTDLSDWMVSRLPLVVAFVLLVTFVVMVLSFGSPWLAAATIGLNALSVGAAYGLLTLVFQNQWAEGLLDFTSIGSIASWLPLLLFVVLFGLSMDYHVFVTSRVREAYLAGASATDAVRRGVGGSAAVVTSAAAVMVGVFSVFGTLSTLEMKELGVGLAAAIALDATVVRGVLLPAVLTLLGDRAHRGPAWLPTLHH
ncbi:MAG: MMPL family transporter [Nocardioides sp.]